MTMFADIEHQIAMIQIAWLQEPPFWWIRLDDVSGGGAYCVSCGCTDNAACEGGCTWIRHGDDQRALCSNCRHFELGHTPEFVPAVEPWPQVA